MAMTIVPRRRKQQRWRRRRRLMTISWSLLILFQQRQLEPFEALFVLHGLFARTRLYSKSEQKKKRKHENDSMPRIDWSFNFIGAGTSASRCFTSTPNSKYLFRSKRATALIPSKREKKINNKKCVAIILQRVFDRSRHALYRIHVTDLFARSSDSKSMIRSVQLSSAVFSSWWINASSPCPHLRRANNKNKRNKSH